MFQVRIHGRGGQGAVSAAEMLSVAAFLDGEHAQAFPSFGSERNGAPVVAYCRIDTRPIRLHEPVLAPDGLIIQDPTLLHQIDVFAGVPDHAYVIINSKKTFNELGLGEYIARFDPARVLAVPATEIALKHVGRAVPNVPLLGAFAALAGQIRLPSVLAAIRDKFPTRIAEPNVNAAQDAHDLALECKHALVEH